MAAGKKASNSILSFVELSRKLKQDGAETELVEVVSKATTAFEYGHDSGMPLEVLQVLIDQLEGKMKSASKKLHFEESAVLRDQVKKLHMQHSGSHFNGHYCKSQ
jgi:excinuclease ABC subunit B